MLSFEGIAFYDFVVCYMRSVDILFIRQSVWSPWSEYSPNGCYMTAVLCVLPFVFYVFCTIFSCFQFTCLLIVECRLVPSPTRHGWQRYCIFNLMWTAVRPSIKFGFTPSHTYVCCYSGHVLCPKLKQRIVSIKLFRAIVAVSTPLCVIL